MTSPGIPLNFYPRPPRGGRPHRRLPVWLVLCHFYPRPPRGGRLRLLSSSWIWPAISIHALREEGDQPRSYDEILNDLFLSTPSARRATFSPNVLQAHRLFLSTPSARRATVVVILVLVDLVISIHALREEGDTSSIRCRERNKEFLSTPSARRATAILTVLHNNSRFLSTPSARRATRAWVCKCDCGNISIHALREEGDSQAPAQTSAKAKFLSTPSARRATQNRRLQV